MMNIEIIKFFVFYLVFTSSFLLFGSIFLKKLSNNIWQAKGILNLIPLELILKNNYLK